jgi:hypothetical protein
LASGFGRPARRTILSTRDSKSLRELGLDCRGFGQGSLPSVPVRPCQHVGDRGVVVELETLGLGQGALDARGLHSRRPVEQRPAMVVVGMCPGAWWRRGHRGSANGAGRIAAAPRRDVAPVTSTGAAPVCKGPNARRRCGG